MRSSLAAAPSARPWALAIRRGCSAAETTAQRSETKAQLSEPKAQLSETKAQTSDSGLLSSIRISK
jgi:hypothetical protein